MQNPLGYLVTNDGKFSGTKTMLTIGGFLVLSRWLIGGINAPELGFTASYIGGADIAMILAALGFNRGFSSQTKKI